MAQASYLVWPPWSTSRIRLNDYYTGREVIDTLTLGDLVIPNQSMGAAIVSEGFQDVDGILGYVIRHSRILIAQSSRLYMTNHAA